MVLAFCSHLRAPPRPPLAHLAAHRRGGRGSVSVHTAFPGFVVGSVKERMNGRMYALERDTLHKSGFYDAARSLLLPADPEGRTEEVPFCGGWGAQGAGDSSLRTGEAGGGSGRRGGGAWWGAQPRRGQGKKDRWALGQGGSRGGPCASFQALVRVRDDSGK